MTTRRILPRVVSLMMFIGGIETFYTNGCEENTFHCGTTVKDCIPLSWRCDGESECNNGADELNCPTVECDSDQFTCQVSGEQVCMPNTWKCDGDVDCPDTMEDESNCPEIYR